MGVGPSVELGWGLNCGGVDDARHGIADRDWGLCLTRISIRMSHSRVFVHDCTWLTGEARRGGRAASTSDRNFGEGFRAPTGLVSQVSSTRGPPCGVHR